MAVMEAKQAVGDIGDEGSEGGVCWRQWEIEVVGENGSWRSEITKELMEKDWLKNVAIKTIPLQTFGTSNPDITCPVFDP
ncbi:hypothetical protein RJ639_005479 [Escallonia herrerae]|uniref:Uncharacterized protein n=1 Tax=Escallonia herrerae TaxID=1293975 RepID=A0AA89AZR2_9ASTE|nr:hypothetical protein RJ639_005479 [Escallonia herrerae]